MIKYYYYYIFLIALLLFLYYKLQKQYDVIYNGYNLKNIISKYVIIEKDFSDQLKCIDKNPFLLYNISVAIVNNELLLFGRVSNFTFTCISNPKFCLINNISIFPNKSTSYIAKNRMNFDLNITDTWKINSLFHKTNCFLNGIEDSRLFWHKNNLYSLSVIAYDEQKCYTRQLLCKWNNSGDYLLANPLILHVDNIQNVEKNWGPFSDGEQLYLIYSMNPFVILKADTETGFCTKIASETIDTLALRNGKFICKINEKYNLGFCHIRMPTMVVPKYYLYFFLFELEYPFKFHKLSRKIELSGFGESFFCYPHDCCNLNENEFILSLGIDDSKACLVKVLKNNINILFD